MNNFFSRLGIIILALTLSLWGCEQVVPGPDDSSSATNDGTDTTHETDDNENMPNDGEKNDGAGETHEEDGTEEEPSDTIAFPEITDFTFKSLSFKTRTLDAVQGKAIGILGDVSGGTPPFTFQLVQNENSHFELDDNCLTIRDAILSAASYHLSIGVTDSKGMAFTKPVTVTIYPEAVSAEQDIHEAGGISFAMRYAPAGTFNRWEGIWSREEPVNIDKGFWIAETEIIQELFTLVMGYNPSYFNNNPAPGEDQNKRPVERILYNEAIVFCNRLSQIAGREPAYRVDGIDNWLAFSNQDIETITMSQIGISSNANGYRLPSEDEWCWAAIGTDKGGYSGNGYKKYYSGGPIESSENASDYAWCDGNSDMITHEVGKKSPMSLAYMI
jgi:hypothetical protein